MDEGKELHDMETATYPMGSLLGDIGGAAGLFLGISVVGAGQNFRLNFNQKLRRINNDPGKNRNS